MNEKELNSIASRLKSRREELGLSLESLANKTGLSRSTLQRYETGSIANIPLDKLEILSKGLDLSVTEFLGLKDNVYDDSPIIRTVARNMKQLSEEDQKLAKNMIDILIEKAKKEYDENS
ncbi:helix-turn-helix domain-containing protein [[Clostridium] colinum]|uniref:helix-turn-helix domain-containing protein n=1 Tax=[Clostridium] colinum TaxID=36835 RepID=UPI002025233E|nr:helix-turn-helix transcriptional regulator [[Clostridium] colinum]